MDLKWGRLSEAVPSGMAESPCHEATALAEQTLGRVMESLHSGEAEVHLASFLHGLKIKEVTGAAQW